MEIKYLTLLRDTPTRPLLSSSGDIFTNKPILEEEIIELEQLYNEGLSFPAALRELLYLAGDYCYLLDYGISDSQKEFQEYERESFEDYLPKSRPFIIIHVYGRDYFYYVYLDEGEDPPVYSMGYENSLKSISLSLTDFIEKRIRHEMNDVTMEKLAVANRLFDIQNFTAAFREFNSIAEYDSSSREGRSDAFLMMGVITLIDGRVENLPDESGLHYFLKSLEYNPQNVGALFNIVEGLGPSINQHKDTVAFDNALKTLTDMGHNYTDEERVMLVRQTAFRNSI